jgi:hypothetical protein
MLAQLVRRPPPGLVLNATFAEASDVVFKHAYDDGFRGLVRAAHDPVSRRGFCYRLPRRAILTLRPVPQPPVRLAAEPLARSATDRGLLLVGHGLAGSRR